jgi:hypothetical protein
MWKWTQKLENDTQLYGAFFKMIPTNSLEGILLIFRFASWQPLLEQQLLDAKGQYQWHQKSRSQIFLWNTQCASWYQRYCHMLIDPNTSYILYILSEGMNAWHLRHSHIGFFNPYHLANFLNYWNEAFVPSHELATICCNMLPYNHHSHKNVIEMCISSFFFEVYSSLCLKFSQIKLILQKFWIFVKKLSQWKTHFPNFNSKTAKTLSKGQSPTEALRIKS